MPRKKFRFQGKLSAVKAKFLNTVIYLPATVVKELPKGRVRAKGTINGAPFSLAPQYSKDGSRYFSVSAALRRAAGIRENDRVNVEFVLVDAEVLDTPEELLAVLEQDDEGRRVWDTFTTGMKRSLIHYVTSVKNVDSRIKRSIELIGKAKSGTLHAQKNKG